MKALLKPVLVAGLVLAGASPVLAASSAPAPAPSGVTVKGIGIVDIDAIVEGSTAYKTAESQRQSTYKGQLDQADALRAQLRAQVTPMLQKLRTDRSAANPDQASLKAQNDAIDQIEQKAQYDLSRILAPVAYSSEYVEEQINAVLPKAIEAAAQKKNVSLMLRIDSGAIIYRDTATYDMNDAVIAEVNALLPYAQITPPPNWVPREVREQYARAAMQNQVLYGPDPAQPAQGDAAPAAPAPAPATGDSADTR